MTQQVSTTWGKLGTATMLLAVVLWGWSAVRTFGTLGENDIRADRLSSIALAVCVVAFLFLGLHERHLRMQRGEAEAPGARQVLDGLRSLPTSANGKVALAFAALGVAGWTYAWVFVRWLDRDMPLVPPGDDGGLFVAAGTLACVAAGIFAGTHFKERR